MTVGWIGTRTQYQRERRDTARSWYEAISKRRVSRFSCFIVHHAATPAINRINPS